MPLLVEVMVSFLQIENSNCWTLRLGVIWRLYQELNPARKVLNVPWLGSEEALESPGRVTKRLPSVVNYTSHVVLGRRLLPDLSNVLNH